MIYKIRRRGLIRLFSAAVILGAVWCYWTSFVYYKSVQSSNPQDLERLHTQLANEAKLFGIAKLVKKSSQHRQTNKDTKTMQLPTTLTQSRSFINKHKSTLITSKTCWQHYFLLIAVSSAPSNLQRRNDIRQTWGVDTAIKPRWKTVFLVAQTRIQNDSDSLLKEDNAFGDLVRADYFDYYWNQTLKIQMGFEWAARYCNFSFLLKTDDDSIVNPKGLVTHLNDPNTPRAKLYMGQCYPNMQMQPHRQGKWKVSYEEYDKTYYPDYCFGYGIVLSADVVSLFVDLFEVVPKFRIDDVYIGMLAERTGIKPVFNAKFYMEDPSPSCLPEKQYLVWHGVTGECLFKLFKDM